MLTHFPIGYAFRLHLRVPANPAPMGVEQETLGFRAGGFSPPSRYLCRHSHFSALHLPFRSDFYALRTPPYRVLEGTLLASVLGLSPAKFSAPFRSAGELLRTL